ncbi:MAG: hypothetical protein HC913_19010 [Microscillaceae bacterium]|nr:hypothetical protein [Microscillaceae bacterium]
MISFDYFLLLLAHLAVLTFVSYKIARLRNRNGNNDDDDEGGTGFDLTPPKLDLPPGIVLPRDVPEEMEAVH